SGLHCSIPKGTSAPGNVFPFADVPVTWFACLARGWRTFTNGSTNRVRSRVALFPAIAVADEGRTTQIADASSAAVQSEEQISPPDSRAPGRFTRIPAGGGPG